MKTKEIDYQNDQTEKYSIFFLHQDNQMHIFCNLITWKVKVNN